MIAPIVNGCEAVFTLLLEQQQYRGPFVSHSKTTFLDHVFPDWTQMGWKHKPLMNIASLY
jgi:hypothetical protein